MVTVDGIERAETMRRAILLIIILLSPLALISNGVSQTSGRACSADPPQGTVVDHIEISPGGPISMPADAELDMTAIAYDAQGTELNVPLSWNATNGTLHNFDAGSARWYPEIMGAQTVTVCTGEIVASLAVNVQPGAPASLDLVRGEENITADQTIEVTPLLVDQYGNGWIPNIPFVNWTLPEGTSITLPNDGTSPVLTPGPTGLMTVDIVWGQWSASVTFNVTIGAPVALDIEHDSSSLSSDDMLDLCARLLDQRGNMWGVAVNWSTHDGLADGSLSDMQGECTVFDAGPIGDWTVIAEAENGMSSGLALSVTEGRLAQIRLDGLPTEMQIGEPYPLVAIGLDAAGNAVTVAGWNWSVTDGPSENAILLAEGGAKFVPNKAGQHTIQVMAAGRVQAIDVEVHPGAVVLLEFEILDDATPRIVTGESIDLLVFGVDENGNRNPVDLPIEQWVIQSGFGTINASAGGTGHYTYTAGGIGFVSLSASLEGAEGTLIFEVLVGELDHLEVLLPSDGDQGNTVHFNLRGYDISGNVVEIHPCSAIITTDVGKATCDEDGWTLGMDSPGEQVVHARIGSAEGSEFIDVHPTWFGWGNDTEVIIVSSLVIIAVISSVLVLLFRHLGHRIKDEIEAIDEEVEEEDTPVIPQVVPYGLAAVMPPPLPIKPTPSIPPPPAVFTPVVQAPLGWVQNAPAPATEVEPVPVPLAEPVVKPDIEPWPDPLPEAEPIDHNEEGGWVEESEPESEPEPEPIPVRDDEWGEMTGDWDVSGETLTSATMTATETRHEHRRGEGPRDAADQALQPLPGTTEGTDGWYFNREGRPTLWHNSEASGWTQQ
jgi:hypothetical protein